MVQACKAIQRVTKFAQAKFVLMAYFIAYRLRGDDYGSNY